MDRNAAGRAFSIAIRLIFKYNVHNVHKEFYFIEVKVMRMKKIVSVSDGGTTDV